MGNRKANNGGAAQENGGFVAPLLNPPYGLNATKSEEIQAIVAANEKMPQKSTYFYPKLSSGLIVNKIDPDGTIEADTR